MKRMYVIGFILATSVALAAEAPSYTVTAEQWASPRHGLTVARLPGLAQAVQALQATPGSVLVLNHPGGDEGTVWAQELRAWLIALGVGSDRLRVRPGQPRDDVIELSVVVDTAVEKR